MGTVGVLERPGGWRRRTRESRWGNLLVLAVTAVVISAAAYVVDRRSATDDTGLTAVTLTGGGSGSAPVVGKPAQDFTATTADGKQISLASLRGHPVWLTFGASWCSACRAEAPDIEGAYRKAQAGGAVVVEVFISEDSSTVHA